MTSLVAAGLDRNSADIAATPHHATSDPTEHAARAERLQRLYARRARWWAVLERIGTADHTVATVYLRAVVQARCAAEAHAADWAANAERWTQHTQQHADELAVSGRGRSA